MSALADRILPAAAKGKRQLMTRVIKRGQVPRLGFQHYFIEAEGLHSRVHLQNFWSTFAPHIEQSVDGHLDVFAADGRHVGRRDFTVPQFGSLFLEVRDLLAGFGASEPEGTLTIDLEPAREMARDIATFPLDEPWSLRFQTPFWMAYYDDAENYMYVHAIDRFAGAFHGVPRVVDRMLRREFAGVGEPWRAGRLLDASGISELQIVVINHGTDTRSTTVGLYTSDGSPVWQASTTLGPRAVQRLRVDQGALRRHVDGGGDPLVRLGMDPLLTMNGKPYVLMRYGDGPLSLHHG